MYRNKKISVIIAAGGSGKRMNGTIPKQYLKIGNQPVLIKTIKAFLSEASADSICVAVAQDYRMHCKDMFEKYLNVDWENCEENASLIQGVAPDSQGQGGTKIKLVIGGSKRQHSVYEAIKAEEAFADYILIHDGARPFIHEETIKGSIEKTIETGATVTAIPLVDTIRNSETTLSRDGIYRVQTPQGFETKLLVDAYEKAFKDNYLGTDDASLVERLGKKISISEGTSDNIKITVKEDLPMENCIGTGYDVHRLTENRKLILGGVDIPFEKGLLGHSDADVLIHAIMDALLGAAALGDIGKLFPDSDDSYKGISSLILLEKVAEKLLAEGFTIGNIDCTLIAQRPKIAKYIEEMKSNISKALNIESSRINIKGTTTEGLGFAGKEEGIAAQAVCILTR